MILIKRAIFRPYRYHKVKVNIFKKQLLNNNYFLYTFEICKQK